MISARMSARRVAAAVFCFGLIFALGCGDVYRPIATPVVQPGGDPQGREIDAVINHNPMDQGSGSATFVDVSGDANVGNIPAGIGVTRAAFDPFNITLYIPNPGSNNVTSLTNSYASSGVTTAKANITVNAGTNPSAIFPGSGSMYTLNQGHSPSCSGTGSIGIIDVGTLTLTQDLCIGTSPTWATYATSQNLLFVLDGVENVVYAIYAPKNLVQAVLPVGTTPVWSGLSIDGKYLFVVNKGSADISVIDVNALTVGSTTTPTGGTSPTYGYLDTKLNRLYVVNQGSETLSTFDASSPLTLTALHTPVSVSPGPTRVSSTADGLRLYVPNTTTNTVTVVQAGSFATSTLAASADSSLRVTDAAISRDGNKLLVTMVSADDTKNQTAIFRTSDNVLANVLAAPRQDLGTCEPAPDAKPPVTCTSLRQRPMQITGSR